MTQSFVFDESNDLNYVVFQTSSQNTSIMGHVFRYDKITKYIILIYNLIVLYNTSSI